MASWVDFFREAAERHLELGIRVEYAGVETETNTFVWLRSFDDEAMRRSLKDEFYGGQWWLERESFAMDHVLEYETVFLEGTLVRSDVGLESVPWPADGARGGTTGDSPPDGWHESTRTTVVRDS
jgi:hypothetical protein